MSNIWKDRIQSKLNISLEKLCLSICLCFVLFINRLNILHKLTLFLKNSACETFFQFRLQTPFLRIVKILYGVSFITGIYIKKIVLNNYISKYLSNFDKIYQKKKKKMLSFKVFIFDLLYAHTWLNSTKITHHSIKFTINSP